MNVAKLLPAFSVLDLIQFYSFIFCSTRDALAIRISFIGGVFTNKQEQKNLGTEQDLPVCKSGDFYDKKKNQKQSFFVTALWVENIKYQEIEEFSTNLTFFFFAKCQMYKFCKEFV